MSHDQIVSMLLEMEVHSFCVSFNQYDEYDEEAFRVYPTEEDIGEFFEWLYYDYDLIVTDMDELNIRGYFHDFIEQKYLC